MTTQTMHRTAVRFAVRYGFRLRRDDQGRYWLVGADGQAVDCPAWGETTAAGAIRVMRKHLRVGWMIARVGGKEER